MSDVEVRVGSGDGVVARHGSVAMVVRGSDADVDTLLELVSPGDGGTTDSTQLLAAGRRARAGVAFAAVSLGSEIDVVLVGDVRCEVIDANGNATVHTGADTAQLIALPEISGRLTLTLPDGGVPAARSTLGAGVVPGGAVAIVTAADPPTRAVPILPAGWIGGGFPPPILPPPPADPAAPLSGVPSSASYVNLLLAPVPADHVPGPLPVGPDPEPVESGGVRVRGVACGVGHVNRLDARYCSSCGRRLQQTISLREGLRPPLGTLIFDDGATYGLDHGYVIGRDPSSDAAVSSGRSRSLVLDDPDRSISRVHAEIRLDGWDVLVVDRQSANGTYVFAPGATEWSGLQPDVPVTLGEGWSVAVGRRTFVFQPR